MKPKFIFAFFSGTPRSTPTPIGYWHILKVYGKSDYFTVGHLDYSEFDESDVESVMSILGKKYDVPIRIGLAKEYLESIR